jgi:hypothetical protein
MADNPYGYGANNPERLMQYLTRTTRHACFASEEDLYAAQYIESLEQHIQALQAEIIKYKHLYEDTHHQYTLDSQRLVFCLTEGAILEDDNIHIHLEHEVVINGDYRHAIDRLMED